MVAFVYFDAGGTLIDPYPSVGEVYAAAGRPHGLTAAPRELQRAFRRVWLERVSPESQSVLTMGRDEEKTHQWWRAVVFDVLEHVGFTGEREVCFRSFFRAFEDPRAWRVYDDVAPTLARLAAENIPCGILSNWDYRLPALLDALDLSRHFNPILVSAFERLAKPDLAFFQRARERVDLPAEQILYVGDRADLDLRPAARAGFSAKLIDRSGRQSGAIRTLEDILG